MENFIMIELIIHAVQLKENLKIVKLVMEIVIAKNVKMDFI
jgi:hypothetical protein